MTTQPIIVFITTPSVAVGRQIADMLLEKRLAACTNILPGVTSVYTWEGQPHADEEALLVVKTRAELFKDRLVPAIKAIHPYLMPEILALPILMGSEEYLEWLVEATHPAG